MESDNKQTREPMSFPQDLMQEVYNLLTSIVKQTVQSRYDRAQESPDTLRLEVTEVHGRQMVKFRLYSGNDGLTNIAYIAREKQVRLEEAVITEDKMRELFGDLEVSRHNRHSVYLTGKLLRRGPPYYMKDFCAFDIIAKRIEDLEKTASTYKAERTTETLPKMGLPKTQEAACEFLEDRSNRKRKTHAKREEARYLLSNKDRFYPIIRGNAFGRLPFTTLEFELIGESLGVISEELGKKRGDRIVPRYNTIVTVSTENSKAFDLLLGKA